MARAVWFWCSASCTMVGETYSAKLRSVFDGKNWRMSTGTSRRMTLGPLARAPSCAEAGVLGVVPGIIGLLQAAEALKLLLGAGVPLVGRMLHYDGLRGRFDEFEVPRDPRCPACAH